MPQTQLKITRKGFATEHAPAPAGGMKRYGRWTIDLRMFDASINEIDSFTCRQDLWTGEEEFAVRLTRENDGSQFEDRGAVKGKVIDGASGFGGKLTGRLLQNNGVFLEGKGGSVDFVLVATQTGPDHFRCFRRFEVKAKTKLWGTEVSPGTCFITTEDQLLEDADEPPAELLTPLARW